MTTILGIDPGLKGGYAYLTPQHHGLAYPMPLVAGAIDFHALAEEFAASRPDIVVIEKVGARPGQGVVGMFTFGLGYGGLLGICAALKLRVELVAPQTWQGDILRDMDRSDTKQASIAYCRRAFPKVELTLPGCRKPHDGMSDALCLAAYGSRHFSPAPASKELS